MKTIKNLALLFVATTLTFGAFAQTSTTKTATKPAAAQTKPAAKDDKGKAAAGSKTTGKDDKSKSGAAKTDGKGKTAATSTGKK